MSIITFPEPSLAIGGGSGPIVLGWSQNNADQSGIAAPNDITGLSTTVFVPSGRTIRIRAEASIWSTVGGDLTEIRIYQDGVQMRAREWRVTTANVAESATIEMVLVPTAGVHTYNIRIGRGFNATGTIGVVGVTPRFAHILVEDITGTPAPGVGDQGIWVPWTPTYQSITVGSGTVSATYTTIGRTIHWRFRFLYGTGSAVGTNPGFTLPVPASTYYAPDKDLMGIVSYRDAGVATYQATMLLTGGSQQMTTMYTLMASGTYVTFNSTTATVPFTWAPGDEIVASGTYEAA